MARHAVFSTAGTPKTHPLPLRDGAVATWVFSSLAPMVEDHDSASRGPAWLFGPWIKPVPKALQPQHSALGDPGHRRPAQSGRGCGSAPARCSVRWTKVAGSPASRDTGGPDRPAPARRVWFTADPRCHPRGPPARRRDRRGPRGDRRDRRIQRNPMGRRSPSRGGCGPRASSSSCT